MTSRFGVMDYQNFLWRLLGALTEVRLSNDPRGTDGNSLTEASSLINRGLTEGYISAPEFLRLNCLLGNAARYSSNLSFPDARNAGPYMPTSVWFKRHNAEIGATVVKLGAQDSANERLEPVPAPTTRRELRLLCLLVPTRDGSTRALPVHTMQPLPPRARLQGLIDRTLAREAGFHLRETQATAPTASVLERCLSKLHLGSNGRISVLEVNA